MAAAWAMLAYFKISHLRFSKHTIRHAGIDLLLSRDSGGGNHLLFRN